MRRSRPSSGRQVGRAGERDESLGGRETHDALVIGAHHLPASLMDQPVVAPAEEDKIHEVSQPAAVTRLSYGDCDAHLSCHRALLVRVHEPDSAVSLHPRGKPTISSRSS
jgi:hypothetical protein